MITEEVKKEIEELVREGEKLIDALRREGNNSKDLVLFLCTYERWYTRSLRHIKTIIHERVNDFVLLSSLLTRRSASSTAFWACSLRCLAFSSASPIPLSRRYPSG